MTRQPRPSDPSNHQLNDAIVRKDVPAVRKAIDEGANLNMLSGGAPPLHLATMIGSSEIVQALVDGGADVNGRDAIGRTAIHYAAMGLPNTDMDLVKLLIDLDADVNAKDQHGCQPLDLAAGGQIPESAVALAKAGATCQTDRMKWVQQVSAKASRGSAFRRD